MEENHELCLTDSVLSGKNIIEAIHDLSTSSASGPDGIPSSLLGNCATELAPLLLILLTHFLLVFPIPLTFVISKVLERINRKQVSSFIEKKCCLNSTQHGFRSGRSCLSYLLSVFDDILHMLEAGGSVDMLYLEFWKAFHNVDHGIRLHKLKALGITEHLGIMLLLFFLIRRSHFVRLQGAISGDSPVLRGVPQGTVL